MQCIGGFWLAILYCSLGARASEPLGASRFQVSRRAGEPVVWWEAALRRGGSDRGHDGEIQWPNRVAGARDAVDHGGAV